MKPEEVNAMTDEQSQIKASELMGWTDIRNVRLMIGGKDLTMRPNWQGCTPDGLLDPVPIPDYPNDIAAAWELVNKLHEQYEVAVFSDYTLAVPVTDEFWRCTVNIDQMIIATTTDKDSAPRAITRAFILAMEENHE